MSVLALVGGQYGSEGKGVIAAGLAPHFWAAVRTGGPNAGHSFYHEQTLYKMRSVPCAWVNASTKLIIGAGAVIDPLLLEEEVRRTRRLVIVDPQASIILPQHHQAEHDAGMRETIGSTTEGVGEARIAKIRRNGSAVLARDWKWSEDLIVVDDTVEILSEILAAEGDIMLEGTQGSGLSLHHGHYPYCTSNDTNAAQLAADAGIAPSRVEHAHLVVRTHPIRVAGNSGPTGGLELAWDDLIERGVVDKPERTTVTNNIRRLFTFSVDDFRRAVQLNNPCGIWVTFGDYIDPKAPQAADIDELMVGPVGDWVRQNIVPYTSARIMGIGVGGEWWRVVETGDACFRPGQGHRPTQWPIIARNEEPDLVLPF